MFLINRKALAAIGVAAAATTLFASPAQAATAGKVQVLGKHNSIVDFTAAAGKSNSLTITVSGRTVTLDDKVAIKAGKGCKAVKGDRTKVKCTTSRKPTELSVTLGDKNDKVSNNTGVRMVAWGGAGNDTLRGGSNRDRLFGNHGNDTIRGGYGNDSIYGGSGRDTMYGDAGDDRIVGGDPDNNLPDSADVISGGAGADLLIGQAGADKISGGAGDDYMIGGSGNDTLTGGPGKDKISGGPGKDKITQ